MPNVNREKGRQRDDADAWRRLMTVEQKKQPTPQTPLKALPDSDRREFRRYQEFRQARATRRCARCGAAFVSPHDPASLAACFCPDCQHMVPDGWED